MAKETPKPAAPTAPAAKEKAKKEVKDKKAAKLDSNRFGTKASMVVNEVKDGEKVVGIIAHDALGYYMTTPEFVDSGLADPHRYSGTRDVPKEYLPKESKEPEKTHEDK